jgi:hypothetical protein
MPRTITITEPVQIVQDVQSLRFVQNVDRKPLVQGSRRILIVVLTCDGFLRGRNALAFRWSEAIAVGSLTFVEKVKNESGFKAAHREFERMGKAYALRESSEAYARNFPGKTGSLSLENTVSWNKNTETADI